MPGDVLILNNDFKILSINPLSTITWQNALRLQYTDSVIIVDYYENWDVNSALDTFMVPSVIALKEYRSFNSRVKFTLDNLFLRDNHTCQYCQKKFHARNLTKDHVIPRSRGGPTSWDNIVSCCSPCNHARGDNEQIQPIRKPRRPSIKEINEKITSSSVQASDPTWLPWLHEFWSNDNIREAYKHA